MRDQPAISEYREADCVFTINRETNTLKVKGNPEQARMPILKLVREGWIPEELRGIWFTGDTVVNMMVGISLTIYLATAPERPKPPPRTFKELVNSPE